MNDNDFQLYGVVHGSLGAALLALLVLCVWLNRRGEVDSFGSGLAFASILQLIQAVGGLALHSHYEAHVRRWMFVRAPTLAWWFERKEHLAVGAVMLTWCALAAHRVARNSSGDSAQGYAKGAFIGALAAAVLSLLTFTIGIVVAAGMVGVAR